MKKVAVMLVLSLVFVAAMPVMSFAFEPVNEHVRIEKERTLPDGTRVKETTTVIKPSKSGAKAGAAAGAAAGATIGSFVPVIGTGVGAAVGAIAGGIAGWIYGPAD